MVFFRGGISVETFRKHTDLSEIQHMSLPSLAIVPLIQYQGARAQWKVSVGDYVEEEQLLAKGITERDLPVHSPIPGRIERFHECQLPNGVVSSAAVIRLGGTFTRTGKSLPLYCWEKSTAYDLLQKIYEKGVFFEASSLDPLQIITQPFQLKDLVINGIQSEPYLVAGVCAMKHRMKDIVEGIRILQKIFSPTQTYFTADPDHPEEWQKTCSSLLNDVNIVFLKQRYPQAQDQLLYKALTGQGLVQQKSVKNHLTVSVETVLEVYEAVVYDRPLVEKSVVFSGAAALAPKVYRVKIGTLLSQFLADTEGVSPKMKKIMVGGPFRGFVVDDLSTPITKETKAILALTSSEINEGRTLDCIRCALCVSNCPVNLRPVELYKSLIQGNSSQAFSEGLATCVKCGICSFVCPSRLPLLKLFQETLENTDE